MKILITQFGNETNSFAMGRTTWQTLVPNGWTKAEEVIPKFKGTASYLGGALRAMEEAGVEPLPIDLATKGGNYGAGPTMAAECVNYALGHISEEIKKHLGEFDGVFFAVHGGGCAENAEDLEAHSLKVVRDIIGDIPMMSPLDMHANVSKEMLAQSDGFFGIKTVPHLDCENAGYLAAKYLIKKIKGECNPKMCLKRFPLLIPGTVGRTLNSPGKDIVEYCAKYKEEQNLLDISFFFGFSAADAECSSCSLLVVADGYVPEKEAMELAMWIWQFKDAFIEESLLPAQAIDKAETLVKDGYVVINEASDNPGAGCPGDGTHLLREMLKRNKQGYIMGPITDPQAASYIHENCKVGDKISIKIGGKVDPVCGEPIQLDNAEILNLSNGKLVSAAPINFGVAMDYGKSVRLRQGNVEFIIVTDRFQVYDDRPFIMTGCDMSQYRIVGLKSMNHFRGYFMNHADAIVTADPPGESPINLCLYDYKKVNRPIIPLDKNVEYDGNWPK